MKKNLLCNAAPKRISGCLPGLFAAIFLIMAQLHPVTGWSQTIYWLQSLTPGVEKQFSPPVSASNATVLASQKIPLYIYKDDRNGFIYWSDAGTGSIRRVSVSGGAITEVVTGITGTGVYPRGIYVDVTNNVIYWGQSAPGLFDSVKKVSIAGSLPKVASSGTAIVSGIDVVRGITVDTVANTVYFTEAGSFASGKGIYRAGTAASVSEASAVKVAALADSTQPDAVAIDIANHYIYWSDHSPAGKILRAATNAASFPAAQTNVLKNTSSIRGISLDIKKNSIYWTEYPTLKIRKASLASIPIVTATDMIANISGFPRSVSVLSDTCSAYVTPSVTIAANKLSPICAGTKVIFTATPVNGGTPVYEWYKNRILVGTNSSTYTDSTLKNNDTVWCDIISTAACITVQKVKSNILVYTVNPVISTSVSISSYPNSPICAQTKVTFTASASGSPSFVYQWFKNNVAVGTNSSTYTDSLLKNNDSVWCLATGTYTCAATAKSNVIIYAVTPLAKPSVSVAADIASPICTKTKVTFTATAVNGGTPSYEWYKNRMLVGTNSNTYVDSTLKNNDTVWCDIISSLQCVTVQKVKSNILIYQVTAITPSVSVVANIASPICVNTKVTFTATAVNGGTPSYEWYKNRRSVGTNSPTYVDSTLNNNDTVWCDIISTLQCLTVQKVKSNVLIYTVNAAVPSPPSAISGPTIVSAYAMYGYRVTKVAGVTYTWAVPTGVTINNGQGTDSITVTWGTYSGNITVTASNGCGAAATPSTLAVTASPGFSGTTKQTGNNTGVLLYPNPTSNVANLNLSGFKSGVMVSVTDMAGHIVWQRDKLVNGTYALKLNNLAQGVYIVTIKDMTRVRSFKLVKAN